jgi:PhnB protein
MTMHLWRVLAASLLLAFTGCDDGETVPPGPPEREPAPEPELPKAAPIPAGWFALTPQLAVPDVAAAVDFYVKAFAAQPLVTTPGPDGKPFHAEIKIGDSLVMIDLANEQGQPAPTKLGGTPVTLMVYVDDADAVFAAAIAAGGQSELAVEEMFWGDRFGQLVDPFGHRWAVATHIEDLTDDQVRQRSELMAKASKKKRRKNKPPVWKEVVGTPAAAKRPADYHTVTMALVLDDAALAIAFYKVAFGATERARIQGPEGKLSHAEVLIGDTILMLADEFPEQAGKSAKTLGGSPVMIHHYVTDVSAVFPRAVGAGGKSMLELQDMFWGDRYGALVDPVGMPWGLATHLEDLTPEQINARMQAEAAKAQAAAPAAAP